MANAVKSLRSIEQSDRLLFTAEQTRQIDQLYIRQCYEGNGYELMKKAGRSLFKFACKHYEGVDEWLLFCGAGNNGGDGYVAARLAIEHGIKVRVISLVAPEKLPSVLTGEALCAYQDLLKSDAPIISFNGWYKTAEELAPQSVLVIDAMLGTGLQGNVRGDYASAINTINSLNQAVLAVDIPSGLSSNTGMPLGQSVEAHQTLTFIGINRGLVTGQAKHFTGDLYVDALGVPNSIYGEVLSLKEMPAIKLLHLEEIPLNLYRRKRTDHKGDSGKALFIGGSDGTSGASILASEACMRSGIGLLSALIGKNAITPLLTRVPEAMAVELSDALACDQLSQLSKNTSAICIGPGLTKNPSSKQLLIEVLKLKVPTIIDADGLNLLSQDSSIWATYGHNLCVLTPHPMEAARLLDIKLEDVMLDRFLSMKKLVNQYQCTVLLKGSGTLISSPNNNVFVCYLGNESMAVGGMGDVLSGIILAFLAKSGKPLESTKYAALIHAMTAEEASKDGVIGCLPTDLIERLRWVINETLTKRRP